SDAACALFGGGRLRGPRLPWRHSTQATGGPRQSGGGWWARPTATPAHHVGTAAGPATGPVTNRQAKVDSSTSPRTVAARLALAELAVGKQTLSWSLQRIQRPRRSWSTRSRPGRRRLHRGRARRPGLSFAWQSD